MALPKLETPLESTWPVLLSDRLGWPLLNVSEGGALLAHCMSKFSQTTVDDVVVLHAGLVDCVDRDVAKFYKVFQRRFGEFGTDMKYLDRFPRLRLRSMRKIRQDIFRNTTETICVVLALQHINQEHLLRHPLWNKSVDRVNGFLQEWCDMAETRTFVEPPTCDDMFLGDNYHYSKHGHEVIAHFLFDVIRNK